MIWILALWTLTSNYYRKDLNYFLSDAQNYYLLRLTQKISFGWAQGSNSSLWTIANIVKENCFRPSESSFAHIPNNWNIQADSLGTVDFKGRIYEISKNFPCSQNCKDPGEQMIWVSNFSISEPGIGEEHEKILGVLLLNATGPFKSLILVNLGI